MHDEQEFARFVASILSKHPEWLNSTLSAVSEGMRAALSYANHRTAIKDRGMLAAMSLVVNKRVGGETKAALHAAVCEAINPANASKLEQAFLDDTY